MFKDTVSFEDYNGNTVIEDLYFNISKPELAKLNYSVSETYLNKLEKMQEALKNRDETVIGEVIDFFEEMVSLSYGIKSDDGKRFIKSEEIAEEFMQSNAYEAIFMKLVNDEDYVEKFFLGIIPSDIAVEAIAKQEESVSQ